MPKVALLALQAHFCPLGKAQTVESRRVLQVHHTYRPLQFISLEASSTLASQIIIPAEMVDSHTQTLLQVEPIVALNTCTILATVKAVVNRDVNQHGCSGCGGVSLIEDGDGGVVRH